MDVAGSFGRVGRGMALDTSNFLAMDNHLLVEELKAATSGSIKAIHDRFALGLFAYCWFVLRNADAAQVAVRDSLIVAQAHIARPTEPELPDPCLYPLPPPPRPPRPPPPP